MGVSMCHYWHNKTPPSLILWSSTGWKVCSTVFNLLPSSFTTKKERECGVVCSVWCSKYIYTPGISLPLAAPPHNALHVENIEAAGQNITAITNLLCIWSWETSSALKLRNNFSDIWQMLICEFMHGKTGRNAHLQWISCTTLRNWEEAAEISSKRSKQRKKQ